MSAPRTNLETQKRRHLAPLIGMALVVIFGVGLILYWQAEEAAQGNSPDGEEAGQVDPGPNDATDPLPRAETETDAPTGTAP